MRRRVSAAWADVLPALAQEANALAQMEREAALARRIHPPLSTAPVRRREAKGLFARMHAVIEAGGEV